MLKFAGKRPTLIHFRVVVLEAIPAGQVASLSQG